MKQILFALLLVPSAALAQSNIIKTPYLLEENTLCIATMKAGLPLRERFNYNCESQRLEFLDEDGVNRELINPEDVDTLYLGSHKMVPYQQRFLDVYYKAPAFELLIDYKLSAANKGKVNNGFGIKSQANGIENVDLQTLQHVRQENRYKNLEAWEYVPRHTYYIHANGKTRHFNNKKSLLKLYPDRKEEIETLTDKMNVSFSNPDEVVNLLKALFEK